MKIVRVILGALALAIVSVDAGTVAAQGLPQRVDALENKVEMLENALSRVTDSVAALDSRADSFQSTANSLERRVGALEERLDAVEEALAGFTCPEGQFVRGFNTSGDPLCAAPAPSGTPDDTIALPELAAVLRAELNELLVTNATFIANDLTGQFALGSFSLTDITLQLACSDECVPTLEARTRGDGSTLIADYHIDGTIEVTGAAEITSDLFPGPINATFVVIYEQIGVRLVSEIDQADGSVVSVMSSSSPNTTEAEIMGGDVFGDLANLFVNLFQSQMNSSLNAFLDHIHAIALGDLEPIDLPSTGI